MPLRLAVGEEVKDMAVDMTLESGELRKAIKQARAERAQLVFERMKADYIKIKGLEQ